MIKYVTNLPVISRRLIAVLTLMIALAGASPILGAEHPDQQSLLAEGLQAFEDQQYRAALETFNRFVEAQPEDGRGYLFRGLTLNRLGAFRLALVDLLLAEKLGQSFSRLDFEIAWAWLETGVPNQARLRLEPYVEANPDDAKAHEFLGPAWLGLGDLDKGEASLNRALELDPDLEPTVRFYLAAVEHRRGNARGSFENLAGVILRHPESRLGRRLGETFPEIQVAEPEKPWRVALTLGLGYNDNVIALPDDFALPDDISSTESVFKRLGFSGAYDISRTEDQVFSVGYSVDTNFINQVEGFDVVDQFAYLNYTKRLRPDLTGSVLLSDQYTIVDDDRFRNEIAIRPTLAYRLRENIVVEGAYRFATNNYFRDTTAVNDRDANTHTVAATGSFLIPDYDILFTAGYVHSWINADGANFEAQSDSIRLVVRASLPWQVTAEASVSRTWDDYDNPNTLSLTGEVRDDITNRFTARLTRPVFQNVSAYLNFARTDKDSNISFFEYDQDRWEVGLTVSF